jgi:hypothetical protein
VKIEGMALLCLWKRRVPTGIAVFACAAVLGSAATPAGSAERLVLPDPCSLIPASLIAAAFGVKKAPASTSTSVPNVETCSWNKGQLTISVGYTALTNPAAPLTVAKVPAVRGGQYETYPGKKSQLTFVEGTAATGTYVVIRNYVRVPEKKLVTIAKALAHELTGTGGSASGGLIP